MEMACVSDDWEHHVVNPLLQDMSCGDEEYFNAQEVSQTLFFLFPHFQQEAVATQKYM